MKYGVIAVLCVVGSTHVSVAADHMTQRRRRFTPQAVVLAKQKLVQIANGPHHRRLADARHTLEALLTDYGVASPRARANDLLGGNYTFLRAFPANDRASLAVVIADLVALFPLPAASGMERVAALLRPKLEKLTLLQLDGNSTVAARASRLIEIASSSEMPSELRGNIRNNGKVAYWTTIANAFLKRGRSGLLHRSGLSKPQVAQLTKRKDELVTLTRHPVPRVAERATWLLQVVEGKEVPDRSTESLTLVARGFLKRGLAGLEDYTDIDQDLVEALSQNVPTLKMLAKDDDVTIAKRAIWLLKLAQGEAVTEVSGLTLKDFGEAFLEDGKLGLRHGLAPSDKAITALTKKLPELERLARDEDVIVAERARWLIQIATGKHAIGPVGLEKRDLTAAFLNQGRSGLLLGRPIGKRQRRYR